MQFANNEIGKRVHIGESKDNSQYFCPYCSAPMIPRRGSVNIPHFAHVKNRLCSDNWKYEEMSEWHLSWQAAYPVENREVALLNEFGKHRADILVNDTVIEFQHSPLSSKEFKERNDFYVNCGYRVIWVFDVRENYQKTLTFDNSADLYQWKYPPKTLTGFNLFSKVQVYFHLKDATEEDDVIIRLTSFSEGDLSHFKSAPSAHYNKNEFVELTTTGSVKRETDLSEKSEFVHQLYFIRRKNNEIECFGCPINPNGFAPRIREDCGRITCEECQYCKSFSPDGWSVICTGRFRNYLDQIETVLEIKKKDDLIIGFTFIDKDGVIQEATVDIPDPPVNSIPELGSSYNASVMIVRNIKTEHQFMIKGSVDTMLSKYSRIYGFFKNENGWSQKGSVIYGAFKKEWIVVWFKTNSLT